jgi:hypothetical protein
MLVPAPITGSTLKRYSKRYWGAATSQSTPPVTAAAASIPHLRRSKTSAVTGAWISFSATAAASATPLHAEEKGLHDVGPHVEDGDRQADPDKEQPAKAPID